MLERVRLHRRCVAASGHAARYLLATYPSVVWILVKLWDRKSAALGSRLMTTNWSRLTGRSVVKLQNHLMKLRYTRAPAQTHAEPQRPRLQD